MTTLSDRAKPIPKIVAFAREVFPFGETTLVYNAKIVYFHETYKSLIKKLLRIFLI